MKTIIVVEGKIDFNILKPEHIENSLIISFDIYSHKSLLGKNIEHNFIEDYFKEKEKKQIDDLALDLGINWYKEKEIREKLVYEELNLGTLLELEMPSYFFMHLKRIMGIKKIIEKENPKKIISYSLNNYVENICQNSNIEFILLKNRMSSNLFFDKIEIPLNLGFATKKIRISRSKYFKIKKTVDNVSNHICNTKSDINSIKNKESVLLFDFHTINYKDLLNSFPKNSKNIIILNQRKPAVWNLESLNIIKKANCKILTLENFENEDTKTKTKIGKKIFEKNLEILWKNEELLKQIFSIDDYSFWKIIQKDFSEIISKRLTESIGRLVLLKEFFEKISVSIILDWAHVAMEEREMTHVATKKNIPIFCLQHGIMTLNPLLEKYLPLMPVLPSNNSKMLVWGEMMKSYILKHNISSNNVQIVGSPRHDRFFQKREENTNNQTILIASNNLFHVNFNGNDTKSYLNLEFYIKNILEYIKLKTDKKPIIKLHASEYFNIAPIIKEIDENIPIYQHEDLLSILETSDSLISLNYSTILVDGLILKKPTMVVLPERQNFEEEEIIKNEAVIAISNKEELEEKLTKFLSDEEFRRDLISKGESFLKKYFSFQGNASEKLAELLLDNKN